MIAEAADHATDLRDPVRGIQLLEGDGAAKLDSGPAEEGWSTVQWRKELGAGWRREEEGKVRGGGNRWDPARRGWCRVRAGVWSSWRVDPRRVVARSVGRD